MNSMYTFDNFIVSDANRETFETIIDAAQWTGQAPDHCNPLILCGSTSLGKTHLLQAMKNHMETTSPDAVAHYVNSETFTTHLIQAIHDDALDAFREKYASIDILLFDDIQNFAGKPATQTEVGNMINVLLQNQKQVVLASSANPEELDFLNTWFHTRENCGYVTALHAPDVDTCLEILRQTAAEQKLNVSDNILRSIVDHADSNARNVRYLKSTLSKLSTLARLNGRPVTMEFVSEVIEML